MKLYCNRILSVILCLILTFGTLPGMEYHEHDHTHTEDLLTDHSGNHLDLDMLSVCEDTLGMVLSIFAVPVYADYEDGVECEFCGGYRYDDWKCDNGDHCGEGADGDCYSEHHCGECGDCVEDGGLCDDCEFCFECCVCEDKCRGCYEVGETVCKECGEKCSGCDWICGECEKCRDCIGDETYCSVCDICIECADWVCDCGDGCSECAFGCEDCYEKCTKCSGDELCLRCWICFDCVGGEGDYCAECQYCKNCVDVVCACGAGCSECAYVCPECGEYCENCADGYICIECGTCDSCAGGEGSFCYECAFCKMCADYICICGSGCSRCSIICKECGEKCENCADDMICTDCETCFDCVGGEGNYCAECGLCKNCVEQVCSCGEGCSECTEICPECTDKCMNCADDEICSECGVCFDCVGGEGNYCADCGVCKNCVEICSCGNGCVDCTQICPECFDKCMNCADDEICSECGVCFECVGGEGNYCADCGVCKNCVEICLCGSGCVDCAIICEECFEKCENCSDEICSGCGICADCAGDGNFCRACGICIDCTTYICACGEGCSECSVLCEECAEACENCSDEICLDCGICMDCAGADAFCANCQKCGNCVVTCVCGYGCEECADLCPECGEKCSECTDEFCASCDLCRECAGEDRWCEECGQCGDCTEVCDECGLICMDCADTRCEDCGKCAECLDLFCPDCGICQDCAGAMCSDCGYCESCGSDLCGECGEICADCSSVCSECGVCESCRDTCPDCELCEDCCAEVSADLGCSHGICPASREWAKHFCSEGNHCITGEGKIEHDADSHWILCGKGCSVKLNEEAHTFGAGKVTKEATKKEDGILMLTCTECGYQKEEKIPKLNGKHEHEYKVSVTEATCTAGGYTTHTCECGHSWTDNVTSIGEHDYQYKHSQTEHYRECTVCHDVAGRGIHKFGEWKTVTKAGYTYTGEKQRVCRDCGYTLSEEIPMLTVPEDKLVITIPDYPVEIDAETTKPNSSSGTLQSGTSSNPVVTAPSDQVAGSIQNQEPNAGGSQSENVPQTIIKELLTKGDDNTVPALPTLPPSEDGNEFAGWVNKATGEPVKKGDKLTESIEIEPVWKDCGENNHKDENADNHCDDCGYVLVKETVPSGKTEAVDPSETDSSEGDSDGKTDSGIPAYVIAVLSVFGGIIIVCVIVIITALSKKKKA